MDNIVLWEKWWAKISSKNIKPDRRLNDKKITPSANNLNSSLSIISSDGSEPIKPIGLFFCNFFSCNFKINDCAADKHNML